MGAGGVIHGWHLPSPLPPYTQQVAEEIRAADERAYGMIARSGMRLRKIKGRCAGCGAPLDMKIPGCHNCESRHFMRKKAA